MRHLVRNAAKHKAPHARHTSAADDEQIGTDLVGYTDKHISRLTGNCVCLDAHSLPCRL